MAKNKTDAKKSPATTKKASTRPAAADKAKTISPNPKPAVGAKTDPTTKLSTTQAAGLSDRMMRYGKNPPCPRCGAHPVVRVTRSANCANFRCRQCGHRWITGSPQGDQPGYVAGKEGNPIFKLFRR